MSDKTWQEAQAFFGVVRGWGGRRAGAGRKAYVVVGGPGRSHRRRPAHQASQPSHCTMRSVLKCLRSQRVFPAIRGAIRAVNLRRGEQFRIVEFSVQSNHIHLIVEAAAGDALSRGMQSFTVRVAKSVNRVLGRRGCVFPERFHERALTSPRDVKNTLAYVLGNFRKHGTEEAKRGLDKDPCSSAPYFLDFVGMMTRQVGWKPPDESRIPVLRARTWLLAAGWKTLGLISVHAAPRRNTPSVRCEV